MFNRIILENNLGIDEQVRKICSNRRTSAWKIRTDGIWFFKKDKSRLYHGWVTSYLHFNEYALILSNKSQIKDIQTSCNAAIRSLSNTPLWSKDISVSSIRRSLKIKSVGEIASKLKCIRAWRSRCRFQLEINMYDGPRTRSRSNGKRAGPYKSK